MIGIFLPAGCTEAAELVLSESGLNFPSAGYLANRKRKSTIFLELKIFGLLESR